MHQVELEELKNVHDFKQNLIWHKYTEIGCKTYAL